MYNFLNKKPITNQMKLCYIQYVFPIYVSQKKEQIKRCFISCLFSDPNSINNLSECRRRKLATVLTDGSFKGLKVRPV